MRNLDTVIFEGWTIKSFINELYPEVDMIMRGESWVKPFKTREEIKRWCIDNQPYYKKYIPEVVNFFCGRYNIK